jgi:cytidylate kinase
MQPPSRHSQSRLSELDEVVVESGATLPPPRHGFQGDRGAVTAPVAIPAGLAIAISRESGARGGTIGRRVARKLGWAVYDQELLEYMAQDTVVQQGILDTLPAPTAAWVEARLQQLLREENLSSQPVFLNLTRVILALGAQGRVVLIGRGSGYILPHPSTLHARIVAPLPDRIAYMSQWLRLSVEEATERVRLRDERRGEFVRSNFHRQPGDLHQYDLVLNSSLLGEALCVELLVQAARTVAESGLPKGSPVAG